MKPRKTLYLFVIIFLSSLASVSTLHALEYLGQDEDGNDTYELPPFIVDGNDPDTFDWDGYYEWLWENYGIPEEEAPDPFFGAGSGGGSDDNNTNTPPPGQLGTRHTNNTFPYNQTTDAACAVGAVRNAAHILGCGFSTELATATSMLKASDNGSLSKFLEGAKGGTFGDIGRGLEAADMTKTYVQFFGYNEFKNMMRDAAQNDEIFIAQINTLKGPHYVVMQPNLGEDGSLQIKVIDSGVQNNGSGLIREETAENAANSIIGGKDPNGEPQSGNIVRIGSNLD